jgi:hypothetical protein
MTEGHLYELQATQNTREAVTDEDAEEFILSGNCID